MRRAAIAEWILSIVVDPLRASAVVGDLVERRALSWVSVARIAASSVAADLRDRPGALAFLAIRAFILQLGLAYLRNRLFPVYPGLDLLSGYLPVRWLARRAPGREVAAYLALIFVEIVWTLSMALTVKVEIHPAVALYVIALFGGVVVERKRRQPHAQN